MAGGVIGNLMFAVGFKIAEGPLRRAEDQLSSLRGGVFAFGATAGAAMGAFAIASVKAASDFEKNMSQVQMATGQTDQQMQATKEIAKNLYSQNFGENWQDLSSAISTTAQITGQTGSALENTTQNAMLLGRAFGFEVGESVKTADTMMRQFGMTSDEAMTLLAQGAQKGLDKSGNLLETANEYSVAFKTLGFSAIDMFDTMLSGAQSGAFDLDKVGDAVKEFNIKVKDGSKTTIQAFEMLGLNANQMMHTFAAGGPEAKKSFQQVMQMIGDIEDPVQRNTVGVALMGTQFEDLEAKTITAMGSVKSQFNTAGSTLQDINKIRFNSPGEALAMFGRQIETGIFIPVGQKLLPYLNRFGQWVADHKPQIEAFGAAIGDKVGKGIEWLTTKAQELWPTLQNVGSTMKGVVQQMIGWEAFAPIVAGIAAALVAYKAVVTTISIVTRIWTAVQFALNAAMSLNPIGIVIVVIVGLATALVVAYKKSETFRNIVNAAWAAIQSGFSTAMNFITVTVPSVFNAVIDFVVQWGSKLFMVIAGPLVSITSSIVSHWNEIQAFTMTIFNGIVGFFSTVWNSMGSKVTEAGNSMKTTLYGIWETVKTDALAVWNHIAGGVTGMWENIKGGFITGINWVIGKLNAMIASVNGALNVDLPDWMGGPISVKIPSIPKVDGSHANGLGFVPFDGYIAELHKGERVMTAEENKNYRSDSAHVNAPARKLAPARVGGGGNAGGAMNIRVSIDLRADASRASVAGDVAAEVRRQVQKILEETFRRRGLEPEVDM